MVTIYRGYSLIGKTAILRVVILGSSPSISNNKFINSSESSIGWAEHWRCLGCKFESYFGHT